MIGPTLVLQWFSVIEIDLDTQGCQQRCTLGLPGMLHLTGLSGFYRAMLCIRGTWACVRLFVSVSVTSRSSTKKAKRRITQTKTQHRDSSFLKTILLILPKLCDSGPHV